MKKFYFLAISAAILLFTSCKKDDSNEPAARAPLFEVATVKATCMADPRIYPSPGINITMSSLTAAYFFSGPGSYKVWIKRSGSSSWSSYVFSTPSVNPINVQYSAFTPSLGPVAPGTVMNVAVTSNFAASCPQADCLAVSGPNFGTYTASDCTIKPR
jgi:hypothetical protein